MREYNLNNLNRLKNRRLISRDSVFNESEIIRNHQFFFLMTQRVKTYVSGDITPILYSDTVKLGLVGFHLQLVVDFMWDFNPRKVSSVELKMEGVSYFLLIACGV